jgi:glycolate oxidase iron-sulfur subunit
VRYSHLLNIGREVINEQVSRTIYQRLQHYGLRKLFLSDRLFPLLLKTGQRLKPLLPANISRSIPDKQQETPFTAKQHQRKVLLISGCVQSELKPRIDSAARIVFDRLGIECVEPTTSKCCGSLSHHLNAKDEALSIIKNNIDNWLPLIEQHQVEAICMTASGCGVAIKEYTQLLNHDSTYADKAKRISELYKDPAEIIAMRSDAERKSAAKTLTSQSRNIVFHPPCTLQHGMQLKEVIEPFLAQCGYNVLPFKDKHLCCGSAGTYSITQKKLSQQLLSNKLDNINAVTPDIIVTSNIGCQLHIQSGTETPVKHWLELFI